MISSTKKFLKNTDGNMAILMAAGGSCLLIATAAAVDFSDLSSRKYKLQSATDAAVLAATVSGENKKKKLKQAARAAFDSNFNYRKGELLEVFSVRLRPDGELILKTRLKTPTFFGSLLGKNELYAGAEAATYLPSSQALDVALVLDRTGSMAGPNMDALKLAVSDYLTDLNGSSRDVRVSVVPFSDYVNIGVDNSNQNWLDIPLTGSTGAEVECSMESVTLSSCPSAQTSPPTSSGGTSGGTCSVSVSTSSTSSGGSASATASATASSSGSSGSCSVSVSTSSTGSFVWSDIFTSPTGAFCTVTADPQESSGNQIEECVPKVLGENWFGCVGSRAQPYNIQAGYGGQKFPLIYDRTCGQALIGLTDNLASVSSTVSGLTASGSTYIPAGLQWGWRTLDENQPFENKSKKNEDRKKLLILMTDGENTRSQVGETHAGSDYVAADALSQNLCTAIKSSGIDIATVYYSNSGSGSANNTMLRDCASSADLYFDASDAKGLEKAFSTATNQVNEVRLIR